MPKPTPYDRYLDSGLSEPIRLASPRIAFWFLTVCAAAFTVAGVIIVFLGQRPTDQLMGVLVVAFFGGGAAVVFPPFLRPGPGVVFDEEGLYTRRYNVKIAWTDVKAVGLMSAQGTESLCVAVEDYERYRAAVPWNAAWLRLVYRSLPGRLGSVALITALDATQSPDAWKPLQETKAFDFIWSAFEFPQMTVSQVRDLIERESTLARGLL